MTIAAADEAERRLSDVLSEFARTLVTDFPIQQILDHLVVRMVDVLPITGAGITLISPHRGPHHIAASDDVALRFEQLQSDLQQGPCVAAYESGEAVLVEDLGRDERFPQFSRQARSEGLAAIFTFPLRESDHRLGALDLYRDTPGPLDHEARAKAQTLADVASAYLLNAQARADLRALSDRSRAEALHDPLTHLPNRSLLLQRLAHSIERCRRSGRLVAVLFADLDRFKAVNDTYGHAVGDALLILVATRLSELLRPGDTLARIAGDEFVVLCEELEHTDQAEVIAARIDAAFSDPFVLADVEIRMSASVGIAFAGPGGDSAEDVINNADGAMYQAKRDGGARHGRADHHQQQLARNQAALNRDMRTAVTSGALRTGYRPILDVRSGALLGVEAVPVWDHPVYGPVATETIRSLAENSGLIVEIGRRTLGRMLGDAERWRLAGITIGVTITISTQELLVRGFAAAVASALAATGTAPSALTLAVSSSVFGPDSSRALAVLDDVKQAGVLIALDGFGTGYSSLAYLKRAPVDLVKVAPTFATDIDTDRTAMIIITAMAELAHSLGLVVEVDGVDRPAQREAAAVAGADLYQGVELLDATEIRARARWSADQDERRTSTLPPATRTS